MIYYKEKQGIIYLGDCLEVLKTFKDDSIDLIVTSPPYNFGKEYDEYNDCVDFNEYMNKMCLIFKECKRILVGGGRIAIILMPKYTENFPTHHEFTRLFVHELGLLWKTEIIWQKNHFNCPFSKFGSWKSPSNPFFKSTIEYVNIYCKGDYKKEGDKNKIDITGEEFKKWTAGIWNIAPNKDDYGHPATFPEEIPKRLIKLLSYVDDAVLDPFNGTGTTTVVAKKLKRRFFGIDISEKYCKISVRRLKDINYLF